MARFKGFFVKIFAGGSGGGRYSPRAVRLFRYASAVIAATLAFLLCLTALGRCKERSADALLGELSHVFSRIDFNNGLFATVAGFEAAHVFAGILVAALFIRALMHGAYLLLRKGRTCTLSTALRDAAIAFAVAVALIQTVAMVGVFEEERLPNTKIKSLYYQKLNDRVAGEVAQFEKLIPPNATVRLESDLPYKKRDPAMYIQRSLAFHLYPIDLLGLRGEEASCILFYKKRKFAVHVPDGFEIIWKSSSSTGIAAKKRRAGR